MADYGFGVLDFEKPIYDMETKIKELERLQGEEGLDLKDEIKALRAKANKLREEIFANLDSWQRIQLARHPKRPYTTDYVENMLDDFIEIHGDRLFRDDKAILAGFGVLDGQTVCIVGHNKGHTTKENLERNFGRVDDREFWDIRYRLMKVESMYLHYRLLLKDAMEHIRTLIMNLSGALSQLDACFMRLKQLDPNTNVDIDKFMRYREVLNEYVNKFIMSLREELDEGSKKVKDEEILNEVEELVRRYRELLKRRGGKLTNLI